MEANYMQVIAKVTIYTKVSCVFCEKAKQLLQDNKIPYTEVFLEDDVIRNQFKAKYPSLKTAPQIFANVFEPVGQRIAVELIGGCAELEKYIDAAKLDRKNDIYKLLPLTPISGQFMI